jgi:hypothetical protein
VWTVEQWLTHWLDNIAAHSVRYKTLVGYRTDVTRHLVPGIGAHRITKLEPEHIEKLYSKMRASGLAAGTALSTCGGWNDRRVGRGGGEAGAGGY